MSLGLLARAREHLGLSPNAPASFIPKIYLKELEKHLALCPLDDNFKIRRQPRKGYGILTCLEAGCDTSLVLTALGAESDGGKYYGIGSLAPFRNHVDTHHTHKSSFIRRIKATGVSFPSAQAESGSTRASSKDGSQPTRTSENPPSSKPQRASVHFPLKVEAVSPTVPRKRHLDTTYPPGLTARDKEESSAKKPRKDHSSAEPESPLAAKMNKKITGFTAIDPLSLSSVEDTRERLRGVIAAISAREEFYDRAVRKPNKSKADRTRIANHKADLDRLFRMRDELKMCIPAASPVKLPSLKTEFPSSFAIDRDTNALTSKLPLASRSSQGIQQVNKDMSRHVIATPFSQSPNDVRPSQSLTFKSKLSDSGALRLPASQTVGQLNQSLPYPFPTNTPALKSEETRSHGGLSLPQGIMEPRDFLRKTETTPAPTGALAFQRAKGILQGSLPNRTPPRPSVRAEPYTIPQPVASGSKAPPRTSGFLFNPQDYMSDDDDDSGYQFMNAMADSLIEKIGINLPPPVHDSRDEDAYFYGRGWDLYVGPRAKADDIERFLTMAGNAEQFDGNASVDEALSKLGLREQYQLIPGMEVALMAHQAIGVAWMLEKERGHIKGGCLADDMGLGKTVQMIAMMVKNPATDPSQKTTLIIAPLALLDQWKEEIEMKTNCNWKVLIYHGHARPRKKKDLVQYDVILTTYSTMALEWPDFEAQAKKKAKARRQRKDDFIDDGSDGADYSTKVKRRKDEAGLLFQVEFYRIVLDEAQQIRNRLTRSSRAANELRATYRWCLTGTPIINSLTDCYGYLRFLKVRPWYDWEEFNIHIARNEKKQPKLAVSRLQAIISTYQIRRTKESKLDGKRLIELPDKKIDLVQLMFSPEERQIYQMVEVRSQAIFNRYLRAGTVLKNYHHVLVLLLRLRQICSHPCLIQEDVAAFVPPDEVDNSRPEVATELTRARNAVSPEFVVEMKQKFKERMLRRIEAEKESIDAALEDEDCPICLDVMSDSAVVTACKHVFCRECIRDVLDAPTTDAVNDGKNKDERPCPVCRSALTQRLIFSRSAFEPSEKELNPDAHEDSEEEEDDDRMDVDYVPNTRKGKAKAKMTRPKRKHHQDSEYEDDDDDMSDFIVESDEDEEEKDARRSLKKPFGRRRANIILDSDDEMDTPEEKEVLLGRKTKAQLTKEAMDKVPRFLPSTKMKYMMELILKNFENRPDEKLLIVSQWTACLSLVSDYLQEKGIVHVKYQGDMNRDKRDQAVRVFMSKDKARIMLMSLKCGGVGLNLTRANNVISLDLAWSRAVESQAWDRVHRLGQTRAVSVQRLVISDTVEDRIMTLQERKQNLADGSLGEGSGKKLGRLTVRQLASLFGLDGRGNVL